MQGDNFPKSPLHIATDSGPDWPQIYTIIFEFGTAFLLLGILWVWGSTGKNSVKLKFKLATVFHRPRFMENRLIFNSVKQESHKYLFGMTVTVILAVLGMILPIQASMRAQIVADQVDKTNSSAVCKWIKTADNITYSFSDMECHALISRGKGQMSLLEFAKYREGMQKTMDGNSLADNKYLPKNHVSSIPHKDDLVWIANFYNFGDVSVLAGQPNGAYVEKTYTLSWWSDTGYKLIQSQ